VVREGNNTSATLILNTGAPQGCVLSPHLYSLFTHDYVVKHDSNTIIKLADDTTVVGLITDNDEAAYRVEVRELAVWCQEHNLSLNVSKTKELIVDYKGAVVERVESFKFLGVHIPNKLVVKMVQQNIFPLRRLKQFGMGPPSKGSVAVQSRAS
jgi:hypothetical protein